MRDFKPAKDFRKMHITAKTIDAYLTRRLIMQNCSQYNSRLLGGAE